ncbi:DNA alkylation repair protein [Prevotella sp. kh1p2]|uniref:DNA alkylation repair protein n=1 Tax=Prevotella sp. kh1p2 TaxID=1761883 RepID=UPI0008D7B17B|nr:DNA alkylation repair protein [Prevotella sp. kh1p2]SES79357.1 3-methyladenine DNA glycosylase AlkD [Prevotella sp. kh1p2]SNU10661.1 3-methyladenine DNA glycosylase AlkD [Prevotellaceae bacterium KH2P17]
MEKETENIIRELEALATDEKKRMLPRFFKTGKGQYGEGDRFIGVTVPLVRTVAKTHKDATGQVLDELMASPWHEARLCALLILVLQCHRASTERRHEILQFYLNHTARINNWDLVDLSAPTIVGEYLVDRERSLLYRLAQSSLLWEQRIAVVSTMTLIRKGQLDDTYKLATLLMSHPHDLMQKATGWMLREAGKRDSRRLFAFVDDNRLTMPRTMLRYAIEKFPPEERKYLMRR